MIRRRRTTGRHDTDTPDSAALDELRRAFDTGDASGPNPPGAERSDSVPDADPASGADPAPETEPASSTDDGHDADSTPVAPDDSDFGDQIDGGDPDVSIDAAPPSVGGSVGAVAGGADPLLGTVRVPGDRNGGRGEARDRDDGDPPGVITITDEDLPDAVYVEGDLDPDRGRGEVSVVIIDDDHPGDLRGPAETASGARSAIEPRFRDRRIAVRRAAGRRRLRWFVVVGAVVVVVIAALAVLGSPLFSIDEVSVTGAVYADADELASVVEDLEGTPTLIADTDAAEQRLRSIPWVADARVRTRFPSHASIEIRERLPLATFRGPDGRFRVIDREARVLDVLDGEPVEYVLVTSADAVDLQAGQFATPGFAAAAELAQALTPTVRGRVASVQVRGDASDLRMLLDDDMEVRFGAATDLLVKLVRLETVLPIAVERDARVIDVSTGEVSIGR